MGCCASTPRDASDAPAANLPGNSSSRAIVAQQPASIRRPSTQASNNSNNHVVPPPPRRSRQPLTKHINKPLKPHVWQSSSHAWTRAELDTERRDFFDTRTDGRPEIWQTIKAALEVMWEGGEGQDDDGGVGTAQEILNAADITLPTGDLSSGAYDSFGAFYPLPFYIVSDPTNLTTASTSPSKDEDDGDKSEDSSEPDDDALRRREAKGKAVLKPNDTFALRARRSDGVPGDLVINVAKGEHIRSVARRLKVQAGLPPEKRIRIGFLGRLLDEKKSLEEEGWKESLVVNAYVSYNPGVHK